MPNLPLALQMSTTYRLLRVVSYLRFVERLKTTSIQPDKYYYWWRAQAAAYLIRPKPEVLAEIEDRTKWVRAWAGCGRVRRPRRLQSSMKWYRKVVTVCMCPVLSRLSNDVMRVSTGTVARHVVKQCCWSMGPHPCRRTLYGPAPGPGCISIHVRHGDKGVESEVFENQVGNEEQRTPCNSQNTMLLLRLAQGPVCSCTGTHQFMPQTPTTSLHRPYHCGTIVCAEVASGLAALPSVRSLSPLKAGLKPRAHATPM